MHFFLSYIAILFLFLTGLNDPELLLSHFTHFIIPLVYNLFLTCHYLSQ